ncbi:MAG: hypothetical protein R2795_01850 [Saprospiraceae bacterium]
MKKSRFLIFVLLFSTGAGLLAQTVEKTFVKSFNLQGAQEVLLQLKGDIAVQTWDQPIARVQMTVRLEKGSESLIRSLAQAGRYNLAGKLEAGNFAIAAPGLAREIQVNGNALPESISYVVFMPDGVRTVVDDSTAAAAF